MKFRGKLMIRVGQIARDVSDVSSDSKWIIEVTGIDKCPRTISDSLEQWPEFEVHDNVLRVL